MSDPRYQPGIVQGAKRSVRVGLDGWPVIEGQERLGAQPFARCHLCPPERHPAFAYSFVTYDGKPTCVMHARQQAAASVGPA